MQFTAYPPHSSMVENSLAPENEHFNPPAIGQNFQGFFLYILTSSELAGKGGGEIPPPLPVRFTDW